MISPLEISGEGVAESDAGVYTMALDKFLIRVNSQGKPFLLTEMAVENGLVEHFNKICKSLGIQDSKPLVVKNFITLLTYLQMGRGYCFLTEGGARQFGAVEEI